ncbi:extracellular solute-binding protein [Salinibacterium sp. PAMC 21357]|uniref:extracellular solute-binding protein n=1 Tax=Salinibacterium sp. PAMC 21357 TaxID=1112215 RepID=UPI00028922FE|nr:extracellular solute-binding protein [Salinibacterium sp. PAMC 21357]
MTVNLNRRDLLRFGAVGFGSLALLGGTAGCATSPVGTATLDPNAAAADFAFASWGMSEDATKPVLLAAANSFAKSEGVAVTTPSYPFNDYLSQMMLQIRGGQFSGAAQLDVAWLSSLAALGKLVDLSSYAEGREYTPAALAAGKNEGKQLGLPWTIAAIGLVTNAELLDKAGASSDPKTIEEFEDNLRALKGIGVIPYAAATKAAGLKDILVWMQTFGSPIVEGGKSALAGDEAIEAVTWYKKLYDEGLISADIDRSAARSLFAQGNAAIYDDAPVGKAGVVSQSPDGGLSDKMMPIARPVLKSGDVPQEVLWGHLVAVVDGAGSQTAAKFAQWLTSDKAQTVDYFTQLGLPPTTAPALSETAGSNDPFLASFTEKITVDAAASPLWPYVSYAQMETAIAEQVQAVLIGQSSPADAMKKASAAVDALI